MYRAVACLVVLVAAGPVWAVEAPPSTCAIHADKTTGARVAPGREVYCGLDLGSQSVKLTVISMEKDSVVTLRDERSCTRALGMGSQVFDPTAGRGRALPEPAVAELIGTLREFQKLCALDGGAVVAANATQWARDATNVSEVKERVRKDTGISFGVLSASQGADLGYIAGALATPGRIVLDPGSNSFQLSWQERGAPVQSISVPYGYVRASSTDFETATSYSAGRSAYEAKVLSLIEAALGKLQPPLRLSDLKAKLRNGRIGPDIVTLGQNGAVHFVAKGRLRRNGAWIADAAAYDAVLAAQMPIQDAKYGPMVAEPVGFYDLNDHLRAITPQDFTALKSEPVRSLYGQRAMVVPVLVRLLIRELAGQKVIMSTQEVATGSILAARFPAAR
jgi:hypothetical protein